MSELLPQEGDAEWRAQARGRTWYHATPTSRVDVIERDGLLPELGADECVNLSVRKDVIALVEMLWQEDAVMYEVSLEGLPDEAITPGYDDMESTLAIACVIPPENLRRVVANCRCT